MNRTARRMRRQREQGKPATGHCLPVAVALLAVAGLITATLFAFLATWLA